MKMPEKFSCPAMSSKKEFAIVSNLRFTGRKMFMLSRVEHEKSFVTSGPVPKLFTFYLFLV